jgi:hypothetical protein
MKMETLKGKIFAHQELLNSLTRVVDLVNIDGPLLTLYQHVNKNLYLLDWVDRDITANRWLIYRTNPLFLEQFMKCNISHHALFMGGESFVYKTDIDKNLNWNNWQIIEKKYLPNGYFPSKDILFEKEYCSDYQKLVDFIHLENTQLDNKTKNKRTKIEDIAHRAAKLLNEAA